MKYLFTENFLPIHQPSFEIRRVKYNFLIIKFLCKKSNRFYKWISKGNDRTFNHICTFSTTYNSGQDCIVAMVNSGDFTLEQAIYVYANSCERCMNVLAYKYLDGKDGYEEYSEEWEKANTVCDFCRKEK